MGEDLEPQRRDLEALRAVIRVGDESGPSVPAARVYAELRLLIAGCRQAGSRQAD